MTTFNTKLFLCAAFVAAICLSVPGYADEPVGIAPEVLTIPNGSFDSFSDFSDMPTIFHRADIIGNPVPAEEFAIPIQSIQIIQPSAAVTAEAPAPVKFVSIGMPPSAADPDADPLTGLAGWLGTYNQTLGMHNASIFTTIFGAAFVAFFIAIVWGKLVELYGALGGLIGGGAIVGTFWVLNHKLPGFGIGHDGFGYQYGLIVQGDGAPWIDMGLAVCVGLFTASFLEALRKKKLDPSQPGAPALLAEVFPRALSVILGGMVGGAIVGLVGFTGARLF